REERRRVRRDDHAAGNQKEEQQQQHEVSEQAEFLGVHREDEVGGALRYEVEMGLGAVQPPLPEQAAGADGDRGLDGVVAGAQRILRRVEQREQTLPLVVMQHGPHERQGRDSQDSSARDDAPGKAGEKQHEEARGADEERRSEVGLAHDQRYRQDQHHHRYHVVAEPQASLVTVEIPRERQRYRDLHQLRGLDARNPDVEPAPGTMRDLAEAVHAYEQQYAK